MRKSGTFVRLSRQFTPPEEERELTEHAGVRGESRGGSKKQKAPELPRGRRWGNDPSPVRRQHPALQDSGLFIQQGGTELPSPGPTSPRARSLGPSSAQQP